MIKKYTASARRSRESHADNHRGIARAKSLKDCDTRDTNHAVDALQIHKVSCNQRRQQRRSS